MTDVSGSPFIWATQFLYCFFFELMSTKILYLVYVHETRFILNTTVHIVAMDATVVETSWHDITLVYLKTCFLLTKYFLRANAVMCWLQNC